MTKTAEHRLFESYLIPALKSAYGVAYYLTLNPSSAESLVREASVHACGSFSTFKTGSNFKVWFLHLLLRQFTERGKASATGSKDAWIDSGAVQINPDMLSRIASQQVIEALTKMPEPYRIACAIYFVDNLTYQEIADIIGCPLEVVRERIHGGRNLLKTTLCQWSSNSESAPKEKMNGYPPVLSAIG